MAVSRLSGRSAVGSAPGRVAWCSMPRPGSRARKKSRGTGVSKSSSTVGVERTLPGSPATPTTSKPGDPPTRSSPTIRTAETGPETPASARSIPMGRPVSSGCMASSKTPRETNSSPSALTRISARSPEADCSRTKRSGPGPSTRRAEEKPTVTEEPAGRERKSTGSPGSPAPSSPSTTLRGTGTGKLSPTGPGKALLP